MSRLLQDVSQPEVATVFHLPLAEMTAPSRLRTSPFRGERPYWAIEVEDLVQTVKGEKADIDRVASGLNTDSEQRDEVGPGKDGRLEVWGLTGWYLSLLMRTLQMYP